MTNRKNKKLWIAVMLLLALAVLAVGCNSSAGPSPKPSATSQDGGDKKEEPGKKPDISKKVTLKMVNYGNEPKDMRAVLAEMNKIIEKDLNATLELQFLGTADVSNKYNLLLASGEEIDLIYAAPWLQSSAFAKKGAFQSLNNLLPEYAPFMWKNQTKEAWEDATIDGEIYFMPNEHDEFNTTGIMYREDLRKKHNLPVINSFETIEAYLEGIKKNEPGMMPAIPSHGAMGSVVGTDLRVKSLRTVPGAPFLYINVDTLKVIPPDEVDQILLPAYERTKRWNDAGWIPKDTATNGDDPQKSVESGKAAAQIDSNPGKTESSVNNIKTTHPDWEFAFLPYSAIYGWTFSSSRVGNSYAVPKASKNAERAIMLIDKLHSDETLYNLFSYGIEGKHYNLTANGQIDLTGIDSVAVGYSPEASNQWAIRTNAFKKTIAGGWAGYDQLVKEEKKRARRDPGTGFALDSESIKNELAALTQVYNTSLAGLQSGSVGNPAEVVKQRREKMMTAGLDKVVKEITRQWDAYIASRPK